MDIPAAKPTAAGGFSPEKAGQALQMLKASRAAKEAPPATADEPGLADLAERAKAAAAMADRARAALARDAEGYLGSLREVGAILIRAKKLAGRGGFAPWVKGRCGFRMKSAENYMRIARDWAKIEAHRATNPQSIADSSPTGCLGILKRPPRPGRGDSRRAGAKADPEFPGVGEDPAARATAPTTRPIAIATGDEGGDDDDPLDRSWAIMAAVRMRDPPPTS